MKQSEVEWGEVKCITGKGEGGSVFMEKVYRSRKWWEVKDWGWKRELINDCRNKQLQETVHSTALLGCFYLLYML